MIEHNGPQVAETADPKHADQIARFFNSAFNSALLYGGSHPRTIDNVLPLYQCCIAWLDKKGLLTLLIQHESFFVENCLIDKSINSRRLVGYFKRAGMESVTFEKGLLESEMKAFIRVLGDVYDSPSVKAIEAQLSQEKTSHIRINYVSFRKVTADEAIVDKQDITALSAMSMRQFLEESSSSLENLKNASVEKTDQFVASLAGQLKDLSARIQGNGAKELFQTPQEMMDAVINLRQEVTRNIELLKATGKLSDAGSAVSDELDTLSRETILRLIRDEYQKGAISIKRLAQVIRRLLPQVKELKTILPYLKDCLLEDGMSLADYLQLVNSLVCELEDDALTQSLSTAADEMGLSVEEIVRSIKSDPADSARLIILASEIRKGTSTDADQLSSIFAEYIERVSRTLSLDAKGTMNSQSVMLSFEKELLDKFKAHGVDESIVEQARRRLVSSKRGFDLPPGVFDNKVTTFFLDHEIKRYVRYNSPFSALVLSLLSIRHPDGAESVASPQEKSQMMSALLSALKKMLRDLDCVGSVLWITDTMPFIILPMTDYKGASCVKQRVNSELNKLKVPCGGGLKIPRVVVSAVAFDGKKTPDISSFFDCIMGRHKEEINQESR